MAATFGKYPSLDKQWRKMMFSFYPYLSTKNRNATQEEWKIRRLTKGFAYAIFANKIEKMGAEVLGGLFIGKTVYSN